MNNRLENRITAFSGAGSFWSKNVEEEVPLVRALSRLSLAGSFQAQFEESVNWLAGSKETLVENVLWHFKESQIVAINAELNQRLKTKAASLEDGEIFIAISRPPTPDFSAWTPIFLSQNPEAAKGLMTEVGDFILWPINYAVAEETIITLDDRKIRYLLPIPRGYTPSVICTENRELVLGLNFEARDGFIVLEEPPLQLFPARNFTVRSAWKKLHHPHDYVCGVDNI
jgi:hypothetical protein